MAEVTAVLVKDLRDKTGAGMGDCKKALVESEGNVEKAIDWLRQKGISTAAKKASRAATEGAVGSYIHMGGKIGVIVEINCETDFTARNEKFQALVKDVAMHIAAANPQYVRRGEVASDIVDREREVMRSQLKEQGKPEAMWEKIIPGKLDKFFREICLEEQIFVKDPEGKKSIGDLVKDHVATIGENLTIRRFARFALGEGLEKKQTDFAAEVAAVVGQA